VEEEEGTVGGPPLFPYGISGSRCRNYRVADRRLLSQKIWNTVMYVANDIYTTGCVKSV
jgi:hypothetical protein